MADVVVEIKAIKDSLTAAVTRQDAELAAFGRVSEKTAADVDGLHKKMVALAAEFKAATDQLTALDVKVGRALLHGLPVDAGSRKTVGQRVSESEDLKALAAEIKAGRQPRGFKFNTPIRDQMRKALPAFYLFNDGTTTGEAGGAATEMTYVPGIADKPLEPMRIRDLLAVSPVNGDAVSYVREKGFYNLHTVLTAQATATATTLTVQNSRGFYAGQILQIRGATPEMAVVLSVNHNTNVITLTAAIANTAANGSDVVSDTFAGSPEGTLKPNMKVTLENVVAPVITVAHGVSASKQVLADAPRLQSFIDMKLMDGLGVAEDFQLIYGGGGSDQLSGMWGAAAGSFNWSTMAFGSTKVDAIRRAMRIVRMSNYRATGVILNPVEWEEIETSKASDGHYLYTVRATPMGPQLWGIAVAETTAIKEGEALVGAFGLAAQLHDRMAGNVTIFDQHEDYAARNMLYMLAEERLALEISRPSGLCKITFDEAPAAPEA